MDLRKYKEFLFGLALLVAPTLAGCFNTSLVDNTSPPTQTQNTSSGSNEAPETTSKAVTGNEDALIKQLFEEFSKMQLYTGTTVNITQGKLGLSDFIYQLGLPGADGEFSIADQIRFNEDGQAEGKDYFHDAEFTVTVSRHNGTKDGDPLKRYTFLVDFKGKIRRAKVEDLKSGKSNSFIFSRSFDSIESSEHVLIVTDDAEIGRFAILIKKSLNDSRTRLYFEPRMFSINPGVSVIDILRANEYALPHMISPPNGARIEVGDTRNPDYKTRDYSVTHDTQDL